MVRIQKLTLYLHWTPLASVLWVNLPFLMWRLGLICFVWLSLQRAFSTFRFIRLCIDNQVMCSALFWNVFGSFTFLSFLALPHAALTLDRWGVCSLDLGPKCSKSSGLIRNMVIVAGRNASRGPEHDTHKVFIFADDFLLNLSERQVFMHLVLRNVGIMGLAEEQRLWRQNFEVCFWWLNTLRLPLLLG